MNTESKLYQQKLEEAHSNAFNEVCKIVTKDIIADENVLKLTDLRKAYINSLEGTDYANPDYRAEKLKAKLEVHFKDRIAICQLDAKGRFESQLVYNSKMTLKTAVKTAYSIGGTNVLTEAALYLRNAVLTAFDTGMMNSDGPRRSIL